MVTSLTEIVGTFFLVLTIGLTAATGTPLAPVAIGSVLMVMVYMGGHVSGAHYNPAVTLAVWMRGKLPGRDVLPYWLAQLVGAVLAALTSYALTGRTFTPAPGADVGAGAALLAEALFTFALALVVLNTATSRQTEGNSYFGLAIGFTVTAGAFAVGGLSGGAFNPAVGVGPALVSTLLGGGTLAHVWLYLVGPLVGGAAAAVLFGAQNPEEAEQAIPAPPPGEAVAPAGDHHV
ncbi:MAG TPA: aquaporin [Gemmatimonadaceae bacterium]|nr:aquaporin [Gemmatimonadaceae bacterium]